MIKVLIVDDSAVQHELLEYILSSDPEISVIGSAVNGQEAIEKNKTLRPDVITMDVHMPKMDGITATNIIMSSDPVPIVIISGSFSEFEVSNAFKAVEAGAVSIVEKINFAVDDPSELIETVKVAAGVKVVRRIKKIEIESSPKQIKAMASTAGKEPINKEPTAFECNVIGIGVSTGGPLVLKDIFENLQDTFPPILIVQHISSGFLKGLAEWLQNLTNKKILIAEEGMPLEDNHIYLAPDGTHMGIDPNLKITLSANNNKKGHMPAANYLFDSIATVAGKNAVGIILTGMGADGATGLKNLKDKGAITIAQDKESAAIYGMPGEALRLGAVSHVLTPMEISDFINKLTI